jgi:serine/threonine protein phosphatase PrpC
MSWTFSNPFSPGRKMVVLTDVFTCRGAMHKADNIPNQDSSFVLNFPGQSLPWASSPNPLGWRTTADGIHVVGVFDGHGEHGHIASKIACETARETLERLLFTEYKDATMEDYVRLTFETIANKVESEPCGRDSGATGSIVVVHDSTFVIGHVGDSCALVVSKPGPLRAPVARHMTTLHRLVNEEERERIVNAGGIVVNGYVIDKETRKKGMSVTRALGDVDMQKNGCISTPEVGAFPLQATDVAIIVASDGLWDAEGLVMEDVFAAAGKVKGNAVLLNEVLSKLAERSGPVDDCTIASMVFLRQ